MKKAGIILLILLLLAGGIYLYLRFHVLKAKDYSPQTAIARSPLDLRPALVAKLQQLVLDGSNGLYRLTLENIEPDLSNASVDLLNAGISADSTRLQELERLQQAPDEVYRISFRQLHIEGLGLAELLDQKKIDLERITVSYPRLTVYRKLHSYNAAKRKAQDSLTLYDRLTKHIEHFSVKEIRLDHGTYISIHPTDKNKNEKFEELRARLQDILIDTSTRRDNTRFLFARDAVVECGRLERHTGDGLYTLKTDGLTLNAASHQITAKNTALLPRGDRAFFQARQKYRGDRFNITVPKIVLRKIRWAALFNEGKLECGSADLYNGNLSDFVNDAALARPVERKNNFPYQLFRELKTYIIIPQVNFHGFNIVYTEFYPPSGREGTLRFNDISARITNLINDPAHIRPGMWCRFFSTGVFLNSIPIRVQFAFDMNSRNGRFTADLHSSGTEGTAINQVTEPLALFQVKNGVLDALDTHVEGDNNTASARMTMLYHGLHVTPLKKDKGEEGQLKKRKLLGLIANVLAIKNNNPENNETRIPEVSVNRDNSNSFFNFGWRAIRLAVFKTVGIPEKFAPN